MHASLLKTLEIHFDADEMDLRIRAKISPWELFGLLLCFSMIGIFIWQNKAGISYPMDFIGYLEMEATKGGYYPGWAVLIFRLLRLLPFSMAYGLFCVLNVVFAFFAVRVFLGKPLFVLLSFQLLSTLFYGQMSGILSGGIALCWWGLAHKRWSIAGLGMILAMMKYQVGLLWCLIMIWYAVVSWREFIRILVVPAFVFAISVAFYPEWIVRVASNVSTFPYVHLGITFWNYVGAWALLLWIPALILPLNRKERFFALITAGILSVPYYQHFDLLTLAALPIGWLPILLQVAFFRVVWEVPAIRLTAILPGLIYAVIVLPAGYHTVKTWVEASIRSRKPQNISET